MKNVQVIDGAVNCAYSIYQFTDEEFAAIFPAPGQNIEFIEDVIARTGDEASGNILGCVWQRELHKSEIVGIHGTLFYELEEKKEFYPNKKESDLNITQYKSMR